MITKIKITALLFVFSAIIFALPAYGAVAENYSVQNTIPDNSAQTTANENHIPDMRMPSKDGARGQSVSTAIIITIIVIAVLVSILVLIAKSKTR